MVPRFFHPFPKYLQIRQLLVGRLEREFDVGDRFPTEEELCREFGVSRETVRGALRALEEEGLIKRRRGQGTHVAKRPTPPPERRLTGMTEDFTELGLDTEARVLEQGCIRARPDVATVMGLPENEPLYRILRLRRYERVPLALHESFLPLEIGMQVAKLNLRNTSMHHEFEHTLGLTFWEDHQSVDAVLADTVLARHLRVEIGAPLLMLTRLFLMKGGKPLVLFRSHYRSDRYYYTLKIAQPSRRRTAGRAAADADGRGGNQRARPAVRDARKGD